MVKGTELCQTSSFPQNCGCAHSFQQLPSIAVLGEAAEKQEFGL